jgi:gliding motility-associated-like protein
MRQLDNRVFLLLFFIVGLGVSLTAQPNFTGINNSVVNLPCGSTCGNLNFRIPDLKEASDYSVSTIPYTPFSYTSTTGTELTGLYTDDEYSGVIPLPFNVCFYGATYSNVVIGSNGLITFDVANGVAGCDNAYTIGPALPSAGTGNPCSVNDVYYPRAAIMAMYSDLNPQLNAGPADRKIEWRVEGTAPLRRFIASWYHVGVYGSNCGITNPNTFQIVLYEETAAIDVFIERKQCFPVDLATGANGAAILGIQNWNRDRFVAAPGKNATLWTASNEAYRFTPTGGNTRHVSTQLFTMAGIPVSTVAITASSPDSLNLAIANICPTGNTERFVIQNVYSNCTNPANQFIINDTITVNASSLAATAVATATACGPTGSGTITVTVPATSGTGPFLYSIDGGVTTQAGNVFSNLIAGNYTVTVTDAAGTCSSTVPVTVTSTGTLNITYQIANTSCNGANNGSITIDPPVATAPVTYILTPQFGTQTPVTQIGNNVFSNLVPGNYIVDVRDNAGCQRNGITITVNQGALLTFTHTTTATSCPGVNNGSITITGVSGTAPFGYSINSGIYQPNAVIGGLMGGATYFIQIRDALGCVTALTAITVPQGNGTLTGTAVATATSCTGANNGTITVTPTTGSGPFEYSITNGVSWQTNNVFNALAAGNYSVIIREAGACTSAGIPVTVTTGAALQATATSTTTSCSGAADATITVTPGSGTGPYQYALDGGVAQAANIFTAVAAGSHTVVVTDGAGCISAPVTISVQAGPVLTGTASSVATGCAGVNNGSITVTAINGAGPYEYALNGGAFQTAAIFTNVAAGNHTVIIRNNAGCISAAIPVTVNAGSAILTTTATTSTACTGVNNGSVTITPTNGSAPYLFSIDGGAPQAANTFTGLSAGSHTVLVTDNFGCLSAPISINIATGTVLTGTVISAPVSCNAGNNGTITATANNGSAPYQYSLNGATAQAANSFIGLIAGNYTVVITDAFGCISAPITVTVAEPTVLNVTATTQPVLCNGAANGSITVNATGGTPGYSYSLNGGVYQTANVFTVAAGNYSVMVRDANNCITTLGTINVTEPPVLSAVIAGTINATCDGGNNGTITVTANGGTPAYQYALNGGIYQSSNILNAAPGSYTISVRDINGCVITIPNVVVGLSNNLTLTPTADPAPICEGTQLQLQLNTNATGFSWSPVTGINNTSVASPVVNPAITTTYVVTVSLGTCTATDDITVAVLPAPIVNAGPDGDICYGQNYQLQAAGGVSYNWTPSTFLDNTTIATPQAVQPTRNITYSVIATDANNCSSLTADQVRVFVTPPIRVITSPVDTIVYAGDQFTILASSSASDYNWSPATGLSNTAIPNPVVTAPLQNGTVLTYRVTATTTAGCRGEGFVTVRVYLGPDIYVPTAFTPNDDGKNDLFVPIPVGIKQLNYFRVFNRQGQLLFSTTELQKGWDGKLAGVEQGSGVFVWMVQGITNNGKIVSKKGTVTLIR